MIKFFIKIDYPYSYFLSSVFLVNYRIFCIEIRRKFNYFIFQSYTEIKKLYFIFQVIHHNVTLQDREGTGNRLKTAAVSSTNSTSYQSIYANISAYIKKQVILSKKMYY